MEGANGGVGVDRGDPSRGIEGVETAMVGREPQMKILTDAIGLMIEDNRTQVVTVVGEAGVGKSRLLYEFSNYTDIIEQVFWFFEAGPQNRNENPSWYFFSRMSKSSIFDHTCE